MIKIINKAIAEHMFTGITLDDAWDEYHRSVADGTTNPESIIRGYFEFDTEYGWVIRMMVKTWKK